MSKHKDRSAGIEKSSAHHEKHNSHHFKANEKSLKTQGAGYSDPEEFKPMHEFSEHVEEGHHVKSMKKGGMC